MTKPTIATFTTLLLICLTTISTGCRTAASLGLPVSAGAYSMLPNAADIRADVASVNAQPNELTKTALRPHRVEPGDILVIEPNDFNSPIRFQSDQTVAQDGNIDLGTYGQLYVAGMTAEEIKQEVNHNVVQHEAMKRERNITLASHSTSTGPTDQELADFGVSVRLVNQETGKFYVMGEVNAPGSYSMTGSETVLDAIIAAGGLSGNANDHKIILTRPRLAGEAREILPVCFQQILQMGDVSTNYQLQPGDRIYVPSMTMWEDVKQTLQPRHKKGCPHCQNYDTNSR